MRVSPRPVLRAFLMVFLAWPALAGAAAAPEPDGYRLDDYQSGTPLTVEGRAALDTAAARRLWETHAAVFIDVLPAPRRPDNLAPGAIWAPVPRRDIPGSIWLPEVGRGVLSEPIETWFRSSLERLSAGDKAATLVFYCRGDCWMSWNATKRALAWGYAGAQWYRDGTDGWETAKLPFSETSLPPDMPR